MAKWSSYCDGSESSCHNQDLSGLVATQSIYVCGSDMQTVLADVGVAPFGSYEDDKQVALFTASLFAAVPISLDRFLYPLHADVTAVFPDRGDKQEEIVSLGNDTTLDDVRFKFAVIVVAKIQKLGIRNCFSSE